MALDPFTIDISGLPAGTQKILVTPSMSYTIEPVGEPISPEPIPPDPPPDDQNAVHYPLPDMTGFTVLDMSKENLGGTIVNKALDGTKDYRVVFPATPIACRVKFTGIGNGRTLVIDSPFINNKLEWYGGSGNYYLYRPVMDLSARTDSSDAIFFQTQGGRVYILESKVKAAAGTHSKPDGSIAPHADIIQAGDQDQSAEVIVDLGEWLSSYQGLIAKAKQMNGAYGTVKLVIDRVHFEAAPYRLADRPNDVRSMLGAFLAYGGDRQMFASGSKVRMWATNLSAGGRSMAVNNAFYPDGLAKQSDGLWRYPNAAANIDIAVADVAPPKPFV